MDTSAFPQYGIFCDESSQTKHRYLVIGALFCHAKTVPIIRQRIEEAILPHGGTSELKWAKLKRRNEGMYRDVLTTIFEFNKRGALHFYSVVIDTSKSDHKTYNDGDAEIGFNKYLFTLLYKFARVFRSTPLFYAMLDDRTTVHTPERLKQMLNARVRRELHFGYDPYRVVQFTKSHNDRMIQAADVLTGAIAFHTNGHHLAVDAAQHKIKTANFVARCVGVPTLALPTRRLSDAFDIWHLDFTKSRRG